MRRAALAAPLLAALVGCGPASAATPSADALTLLAQSLQHLSQATAVHVNGDIVPPSAASGSVDAVVTPGGSTGEVGETRPSVSFTLVGGHLYTSAAGAPWVDSQVAGTPSEATALCAVQSADRLARLVAGAAAATAAYGDETTVGGRGAIVVRSGRLQTAIATDGTADLLEATATAQGRDLSFHLTFTAAPGSVAVTPVAGAPAGTSPSGLVPLAEIDNYC